MKSKKIKIQINLNTLKALSVFVDKDKSSILAGVNLKKEGEKVLLCVTNGSIMWIVEPLLAEGKDDLDLIFKPSFLIDFLKSHQIKKNAVVEIEELENGIISVRMEDEVGVMIPKIRGEYPSCEKLIMEIGKNKHVEEQVYFSPQLMALINKARNYTKAKFRILHQGAKKAAPFIFQIEEKNIGAIMPCPINSREVERFEIQEKTPIKFWKE